MQFFLGLYDYSADKANGELVPLSTVLSQEAPAAWFAEKELRLTACAFLLEVEGKHLLGRNKFFGQLNLLVPQMEAAAVRLQNNETALLRAANINVSEGPFLALEPKGDQVLVSFFYIPSSEFGDCYPIDGVVWNQKGSKLYDFFQQNRSSLLQSNFGTVYYSNLLEQAVPKQLVEDGFERDARLGRQLYELLEVEMDYDIYFDE